MKKSLLVLAVAAATANLAHAQTNVTIYGLIDAGIVGESGGKAGNVTKVGSGTSGASRIGFRGTEELGNGLSAVFVLESGVKVDTGELDAANTLFNRQAFVGLKSNEWGTVTLGRQYTPWYNTITQVADPFAAGYAGSAKNLLPANGSNVRTSNTVQYVTPTVKGISAEAAYSAGEQAGDNSAGRQMGAALAYSNGPLNARLAYNTRNSDVIATGTSRGLGRNSIFAVNYDFTVVKAFFSYGQNKGFNSAVLPNQTNPYGSAVAPINSEDSTDLLVGATVPVGARGKLMTSYIRKDDRQFNQDATQWAVGYIYTLSTRTSVYAAFAKINNKNGAGYTVGNNTEVGSGDQAYNLGLRHSF